MTTTAEEIAGRATRLRHAAIRHADPDDPRVHYEDAEADDVYKTLRYRSIFTGIDEALTWILGEPPAEFRLTPADEG